MRNPSELDPLLPQNESAPEISGYGFSRSTPTESKYPIGASPSHEYNYFRDADDNDDENDAASTTSASTSTRRALGTLVMMFSIVVFFSLVAAALRPGKHDPSDSPIPPPNPRPSKTPPTSPPKSSIEKRVSRILTTTPLIDGHNDLAIYLRGRYHDDLYDSDFQDKFEHGGLVNGVDIPGLRKGMVGGAFWSTFVACPANASQDFSDENYATEVARTVQQIDTMKRLQRRYADKFTIAGTALNEMLVHWHATQSMFGMLSIEGLHQVSPSAPMGTLRLYYELGVRAATLTWNCHNPFADAALVWEGLGSKLTISDRHRGGLTQRGRDVVKEMNRLGMLVDISHTSYWTQKSVLSNGTSRAPVFFSHSSAYSICPHPRNVKDDILDLVKDTRGVVMVNFTPDFISCTPSSRSDELPTFYPANNTLHQVARHIVYIGNKIGWDYVGLGSDFDGMGDLAPKGLEGVDKFPDLVAELLKMEIDDRDVSKVVGGNVLRVWREAEEVSRQMQKEGIREGQDQAIGY